METQALTSLPEIEEGEILNDDPEDLYIPLKRPYFSSTTNSNLIQHSDSEDDNLAFKDSSSDSDSSVQNLHSSETKKKKLPFNTTKGPPAKKKKNYNIWCSDVQTEVLTDSLIDCNVDQSNERCRDVESYNFRIGMQFRDNEKTNEQFAKQTVNNQWSRKRKYAQAYVEDTSNDTQYHKNNDSKLSYPREILALTTSSQDSEEDIAKDISNKLCEEKEDLIARAVTVLGKETVLELFEETRSIEANGGMLVMNETRRRTPGGVFLYLLKTSKNIPQNLKNLVLAPDKKLRAQEKKLAARKMREVQAAKLKKALSKDDFPTLLSRTEIAIKEFKAKRLAEDSSEVKNPPPSPATDGKDAVSDSEEVKERKCTGESRELTTYDGIFGDEAAMEDF